MPSQKETNFLQNVSNWYQYSKTQMEYYHSKWAESLKLSKGIPLEDENPFSPVTDRPKSYYRKIWAIKERTKADWINMFLKEENNFYFESRIADDSWGAYKSALLTNIVNYRKDEMVNNKGLIQKIMWCFDDIWELGVCFAKLIWETDNGYTYGPAFIPYPAEQVYLDLNNESINSIDDMRFVIFENYLSKDDLISLGYKNIDKVTPETIETNPLRSVRYHQDIDPAYIFTSDDDYPPMGSTTSVGKDNKDFKQTYIVWEIFYKEKDILYYAVTNRNKYVLKEPIISPTMGHYPLIIGTCITEAHKALPEGFPQVLKFQQESINFLKQQRDDNIYQAVTKSWKVVEGMNVDYDALLNVRSGGIVKMNDLSAVEEMRTTDITNSAYTEMAVDEASMQEMSGITPLRQGMGSGAMKATTANINFQEGAAKAQMYAFILSESFFRRFHYLMGIYSKEYEVDENILKLSNQKVRDAFDIMSPDIYDVSDLDITCKLQVGSTAIGKQTEIQNILVVMDRAIQVNQSTMQALSAGLISPENAKIFDLTKIIEQIMPKLSPVFGNVQEYYLEIQQPEKQQQQQPGQDNIGGLASLPNMQTNANVGM